MYNVYKDGVKVGTTNDKQYLFTDLTPGTSYKLGVSRVDGDRESEVVTVSAMIEELPIEDEMTTSSVDVSDYHIGGGYYELPNGDKVRGKDSAIEALERLLDE